MKRLFLLFALLAYSIAVFSIDTVYVHTPQVPILIDRTDNVWFEMRISAQKGDILNHLTISLGKQVDIKEIKSIRLFYSGVESPARKEKNFNPTTYISTHTRNWTRKAIKAYSVRNDEIIPASHQVSLSSSQPMVKGTNYFWISIEMHPRTSLLSKLSGNISEIKINNKPAIIQWNNQANERRMGIGVRHAWDDGAAAFRIPGIVTTKKGSLLGVYDIRYNTSVDLQEMIDIGVSRSTDKGQSWEPMRIAMTFGETGGLPHAQNGVGDPSILVDEQTGTIWIVAAWTHGMGNDRAWWNSMQGMEPNETAQLVLVKSDDDGKTWSEPINITKQVKNPSWYFLLQGPGRGITMHDGTLVFPIQFIDSTRIPNAGIMYSKDHGKNWFLHNLARTNTTESQVVEIEPGVLMLNMRDNRGGSRAISITKDLGKTWCEHPSNRNTLQEPICMASLIKVDADKNILKKKILLFSNPNTTKGRNHITIKASLDEGLTWPEEYQVMLDEEEGWGYSCLTMIDEETVGIFYESSVAHMTFQAIKLSDIVK